ncbi:MAG TPA: AmmeMemoRadiSam system radical SAM enzyme [Ruminiclostridium sp.]|jgi:pyruvate formate lyase activating enzyme|nr:AmmeMemoRadiSam system radical SAM enzyme [Clostridiaceae bacterium]HAA25170.1 AmmeMemoRadiSam system radical SAM enzyme [Ruminiclostridium sp.]
MKIECGICPHHCKLSEGQTGRCRARMNKDGKIICKNYGELTSIALDPIEKKPLYRFYPGSRVLSIGSYGCNMRCLFCQNSDISMSDGNDIYTEKVMPEEIVKKAVELITLGNIGIAYTYNEPLVGFEYVLDCAKLAKEKGLENVVVTNGYICSEPMKELLPYIGAMNIDLKAFNDNFYRKMGGDLETVKNSIMLASKQCHLEVTTLIIPNENDSEEEMEKLSGWLSSLNPEIPLHISRFFPRYRMTDTSATPVNKIYRLVEIARKNLRYVYPGNC